MMGFPNGPPPTDRALALGLDPDSPFRDVLLARSADPPPPETRSALERVDEALATLRRGGIVLVTDDAGRENEGDLILPAQFASPENLGFVLSHTSGLVCVALSAVRCAELKLAQMVAQSTEAHGTAFTVSVDARAGVTTGISIADRCRTIHALVAPTTRPDDLRRPGHVFPLAARGGGVLERPGHTEAAVDLMQLAGLMPAGVICEVVTEDKKGMARAEELRELAYRYRIDELTIDDIAVYRRLRHGTVRVGASTSLPTPAGRFSIDLVVSPVDPTEVVVMRMGDLGDPTSAPVVRLHSECLIGDVFHSGRCDCGAQLDAALAAVAAAGCGAVLYVRAKEGRDSGVLDELRHYAVQDAGVDGDAGPSPRPRVDVGSYDVAAEALHLLGARRVRLLTDNPAKVAAVARMGIDVVAVTAVDAQAQYAATN